jgi:D-glycero-D-manno-heptose 1,7-bisphosphate phosphatase
MSLNTRPALFLDRDGVINIDYGYVYQRENFKFIEGIFDLCRYAKQLDYLIFVVTNQAGIARDYYTEQDFWQLTQWMCEIFEAENASIDKVYFCPFYPDAEIENYRKNASCRKPEPGMILQATHEFNIDLTKSLLIGDKVSDVEAGIAARVNHNILFSQNHLYLQTEYTVVDSFTQILPLLRKK